MARWIFSWQSALGLSLCSGLGLIIAFTHVTTPAARSLIGCLAVGIAALLTFAVSEGVLWRQRPGEGWLTWQSIGISALALTLGALLWFASVLVWRRTPSLPVIGLLLCIVHVPLWIGLVTHAGRYSRPVSALLVFLGNAALALGATVSIAVQLGLASRLWSHHVALPVRIAGWEYAGIVLCTLVAIIVLLSLEVSPAHRGPRALLAGAASLILVGDAVMAHAVLTGTYSFSPFATTPIAFGYLLCAVSILWEASRAVREAHQRTHASSESPANLGMLVPLLLLAVLATISVRACLHPASISVQQLTFMALSLAGLLLLTGGQLVMVHERQRHFFRALWTRYVEMEQTAVTDPLTGLANQRFLMQRLEEEFSRAKRYRRPLSLLFADIDFFKLINDTYGHRAGDEVLRAVATLLRQSVRIADIVARYGGEEFVIILPDTTLAQAHLLAERLREAIEQQHLALPGGGAHRVTACFGVSAFPETDDSLEALLGAADEAMNQAKDSGRNRTVTAHAKQHLFIIGNTG